MRRAGSGPGARSGTELARDAGVPVADDDPGRSLLVPGQNCWRVETAHRVAVLVDGDAYFRAVRHAIAQARHSVFIVGWDIDSRVRLVPGGANDGLPEPLGDFLHTVVARRPSLRAWVLSWDFALMYQLEREWLPVWKLGWRTHPRLRFRLDGRHPLGASHHQKVVVVDDALAFVGGFDLAGSRWDRGEHRVDEPLRTDPSGRRYPPFHDVQAMLDGPVAAALGELVRERWRRAGGRRPRATPPQPGPAAAWPPGVAPDFERVRVGIARTEPAYDGREAVHEVLALHRTAISAARRDLYFENQYLTSDLLAHPIAARLREPDGPSVAIVSRRCESGWIEEMTMGALRTGFHARLVAAAPPGRYGLYCPHVPGIEPDCLNVHSKVFCVDDALLAIGSANLNNRSMLIDTECVVAIEASGDPRVAAAIAAVRDRLLAEHLGQPVARVATAIAGCGLVGAIDSLMTGGRSLARLDPRADSDRPARLPPRTIVDPGQPIAPGRLVRQVVPRDAGPPTHRRLVALGVTAALLLVLAVAWRTTPLAAALDVAQVTALVQRLSDGPLTPVAVIVLYVVAGLLVVPVTLLIAATGFVFPPLWAAFYAIGGSLASALVTYLLGRWLGRDLVRRIAGRRVNRLSRRIARRGVFAVTLLRLVPVAPFTLVNLMAGASEIGLRAFLVGSAIGMAPGILLTVVFVHHLAVAIRSPSVETVAVLAAVVAALVAVSVVCQRLLGGRATAGTDDGDDVPKAA